MSVSKILVNIQANFYCPCNLRHGQTLMVLLHYKNYCNIHAVVIVCVSAMNRVPFTYVH